MSRDRLLELLADRATQGLSAQESHELQDLLAQHPEVDADALDLAAAALDNALAAPPAPVPASVQVRLAAAAEQWIGQDAAVLARIAPAPMRSRMSLWSGWLVAAACLALAAFAWWGRLPSPDIAAQRDALAAKGTAAKFQVGPFNKIGTGEPPEIPGVTGDVVWDEGSQRGFLRLAGLPPNNPTREQYQIWLVDERGLDFRIDGGVFDSTSAQEAIIPITPGLRTRGVKLVAITIERPGGVIVSDMSRRVVLASRL